MGKKKIGDYIAEKMLAFMPDTYELHRSEYVKEGEMHYLRVYIDKLENGKYVYVGSDDCEVVSKYLSDCLDKDDPIACNYYLEVSSPGMDRPLITEKDFERFAGSLVDIKLYKPLDGSKVINGKLIKKQDEILIIETDSKTIELSQQQIAKINLAIVF